jgi:hypothetical protein
MNVLNFTNIARTVLFSYGEYELDGGFERACLVRLPYPDGTIFGDDAIQSRWTEIVTALTDKRDADAEEYEPEYVERILMPLWGQESDVLSLPATAIIAAHEAGVAAYKAYMDAGDVHAFYEEAADFDLRLCRTAARVAMIASLRRSISGD